MTTRLLHCFMLALFIASCASPKSPIKEPKEKMTDFWKPNLLFLKPTPHDRLYVEVDAVEGCEPSKKELEELGAFLAEHCDKPRGVEIRFSSVIPEKKAKGLSRRELARGWMNGPPADKRSVAYFYILYYDGRLSGDKKSAKANPHAEWLPYPAAIFINRGYRPFWGRWIKEAMIQHETGHILGLALRNEHAKSGHCTEKNCLMNANLQIHVLRLLTGRDPVRQRKLCEHCLEQLETSRKTPSAKNLSFRGPVLVREERGYRVLSLQGATALVIGGGRDEAVSHFIQNERVRKTEPGDHPDNTFYYGMIRGGLQKDSPQVKAALERATRDGYGLVREIATKLRE